MKKILKRALAAICVLVMIASCVLTETGQVANANDTDRTVVEEWNIFTSTSDEGEDIVNSSGQAGKVMWTNIQLPEGSQIKNNLELYLELYLADEDALAVMNKSYIQVKNTTTGDKASYYYYWNFGNKATLQTGWNYVTLSFANASSYPSGEQAVDFTQSITYFNIYSTGELTTTAGTIKLREVAMKNPDAYLKFGENDTHLQLSNQLTTTPETIEASVKLDDLPTEWVIRGASTASFWMANDTKQTGTTTETELPGEGVQYVQVSLDGSNTTQISFGSSFEVELPTIYSEENLALSFWLYIDGATFSSDSNFIMLQSEGGTTGIRWLESGYLAAAVSGWNQIVLPLDDNTVKGEDFDLSKINYIQWISSTRNASGTYRMTDMKLVVQEEKTISEETTIVSADYIVDTAVGQINGATLGSAGTYNLTASKGTVGDETLAYVEGGPALGTSYAKIIASRYDSETSTGGKFGFRTGWKGATTPILSEMCQQKDLELVFWLYSSNGTLPSGAIQLSSSGWTNAPYIRFSTSALSLNVGWNEIRLNLDAFSSSSGEFDYRNINHVDWYTDGAGLTEDVTYYITDMKIVYTPNANYYSVSNTENVATTALVNNRMIFSNTNIEGENPYALLVTEKGYPALLWGTTQYTLEGNVCTGDWVDIKVVRNNDKYIEFYIDGSLSGTSTVTEEDELTFSTAHRIGADGDGGQVFEGRIANLYLYSNAEATTSLGSWPLEGDIQYILKTMEDVSENNNAAVFRGTRADDWTSFETEKAKDLAYIGEDKYWSIVFVPDIQNITQKTYGYDQTWYTMAEWIKTNVGPENIQHVIGAGDNSWDNVDKEYAIAKEGWNKFADLVSWSNMAGNHEYNWEIDYRDSSKFREYFGEEYITSTKANDTYQGYYEDPNGLSTIENSYYRFEVNGVDWMILQLEYSPRYSVLAWAEKILDQYPTDNVILTTHGYLNGSGDYCADARPCFNNGDDDAYTSTEVIWETLSDHLNIKYILCGHSTNGTGSIAQKVEFNDAGEEVLALMINAQDKDLGGSAYYTDQALGMLSILRFSKDGSKLAVQYFAPQYENLSFSPIDAFGARGSNSIDADTTTEKGTIVVPYTENFAAGSEPSDIEEYKAKGYVFAGWFTDETGKDALTSTSNVSKAYAKYVDARVLSVKAQVSAVGKKVEGSETEYRDIRFVTTVDTLKYAEVGFVIAIDGKEQFTTKTEEVSRMLYAVGSENEPDTKYTPNGNVCGISKYFAAHNLYNVPDTAYNTNITVTPYWKTLDGTTVYGTASVKTVQAGIDAMN